MHIWWQTGWLPRRPWIDVSHSQGWSLEAHRSMQHYSAWSWRWKNTINMISSARDTNARCAVRPIGARSTNARVVDTHGRIRELGSLGRGGSGRLRPRGISGLRRRCSSSPWGDRQRRVIVAPSRPRCNAKKFSERVVTELTRAEAKLKYEQKMRSSLWQGMA